MRPLADATLLMLIIAIDTLLLMSFLCRHLYLRIIIRLLMYWLPQSDAAYISPLLMLPMILPHYADAMLSADDITMLIAIAVIDIYFSLMPAIIRDTNIDIDI